MNLKHCGFLVLLLTIAGAEANERFMQYVLDYNTPVDSALQTKLVEIDASLRGRFDMTDDHTAVGVLDLKRLRLAMIHPDRIEYAASVPKIGILLAYFELHPEAASDLNPTLKHELGLMVKSSSNEVAAKLSREMGLKQIQEILNRHGFYDESRGGGIWVGKHYGRGEERYGDPVGNNSHGATVRQVMRFFLLLEQQKLVSPQASRAMREIFESPAIAHDNIKFVKALRDRDVQIIRKWGTWQSWRHDAAVITGDDRHYILVALTRHARGDEYLEALAREIDDLMK